jgi:hypothetical protein
LTESLWDLSICGSSSSFCPCGAVRDRTNGIAEPSRSLGIEMLLLLRVRLGAEVEVMLGLGEITSLLLLLLLLLLFNDAIDDGSPVGIRSCTSMI